MLFAEKPRGLPTAQEALPGRPDPIPTAETHFVSGRPLKGPYPEGFEQLQVAMGCFWGVERLFWTLPGVWVTAVGYSGGITPNPTYEEVCSGRTGHTEAVLVVYDPEAVALAHLLKIFWEQHDPTQGMRQGPDIGSQYRSALYAYTDEQARAAAASKSAYEAALRAHGLGPVTTEIATAPTFYFAEGYHQQYLAKNPGGYCSLAGTGVSCPAGLGVAAD